MPQSQGNKHSTGARADYLTAIAEVENQKRPRIAWIAPWIVTWQKKNKKWNYVDERDGKAKIFSSDAFVACLWSNFKR